MTADEQIKFLIDTRTPHIVKFCTSSTSIIVGKKNYFYPNGEGIEAKYLAFIKEVKKEVIENAERKNYKDVKPGYFGFNIDKSRIIRNACEIDVKGAYWTTAYKEGLITLTTYEKGFEVPKHVRLMAFGSAATLKDVYEFDGNEYVDSYSEFSEDGRRAFFYVSKIVDDLIKNILADIPGIFSLYWVDAIFVHSLWASFVQRALDAAGYEYTTKDIPFIRITRNDEGGPDAVTCTVKISENADLCEFETKTFLKYPKKTQKIERKIVEKSQKNHILRFKT